MRSVIDTGLVARFEVLRAVRTWRALALILLYVIANVGGAYLFIEALSAIEDSIANQMGVPTTRWPGALTEQVRQSEELLRILGAMVGDADAVQALLAQPFLAVFQLGQGFLLMPFLAATAASEAIAIDVQNRAIRFEALRTGRPELLLGRFVGQVGLMLVASLVALASVWGLGMALTVHPEPLALAWGLLSLGLRAVVFSLPFVGFGIACSAWTSSPAWARVMALGGTAGSWVIHGVSQAATGAPWTWLADVVGPLMPQAWLEGLWRTGGGLAVSSLVCAALALVAVGLGHVRFARRDL